MAEDITQVAARVLDGHPLTYGYLHGDLVVLDDHEKDYPEVRERYDRCPLCEQWSPCDARRCAQFVLNALD